MQLPPKSDLTSAVQIQSLLAAEFGNGEPTLNIDGSAVERVSTSTIQLLLCTLRDAARVSRPVTLSSASPALMQGISDLGLAQEFSACMKGPNT